MKHWRRNIIWRRAEDWLKKYKPLVIAVTGSTGKSTTVAAIERVLAGHYTTRSSDPAREADPVAVALTILGSRANPADISWYQALTASFALEVATEEPQALILEVSPARPGDIDWIANHLAPDITVVTNVGSANLELFSTKENIAHEIGSLASATKAAGAIIVNNDDELTRGLGTFTKAAAISYGLGAEADLRLTRANRLPAGGFALEVAAHSEIAELRLPAVYARAQLFSVVAAMTVGHALKIPLAASAAALQPFVPLAGRTHLLKGRANITYIDDSFTATPESMAQSLETLRTVGGNRRIAMIGDIENLGRHRDRLHRLLGRQAAAVAAIVIAVGENMRVAGAEALKAGADAHHFTSAEDAGKWLADFLQPHDALLVSGGRHMNMNAIIDRLQL